MAHVEAHHGGRQQADGAEDRIAPAHAVGNREDFLAAQGGGQFAEPARLAGDGDHAAAELLHVAAAGLSQGLEEDAEGDGRFQRAAALADDDDAPIVAALDQIEQALDGVVVDVVALEVDARPAAAPLARNLVVIRMAAGVEHRPGAHVRAADAQHQHAIHFFRQPIARGADAIQQRPLLIQEPLGQIEEGGVQRLLFLRHAAAARWQSARSSSTSCRAAASRGASHCRSASTRPICRTTRRGVFRNNQTGIVVGDRGQRFHGRGQRIGGQTRMMNDEMQMTKE